MSVCLSVYLVMCFCECVGICVHGCQKRTSGVLLCHSPLIPLRKGLSLHLGHVLSQLGWNQQASVIFLSLPASEELEVFSGTLCECWDLNSIPPDYPANIY